MVVAGMAPVARMMLVLPWETESAVGRVEDARTAVGVLLVDLEALDDGIGGDHERRPFASVSEMALMLVNLQQGTSG
jgi:hypothetical protein